VASDQIKIVNKNLRTTNFDSRNKWTKCDW